MNDELGPSGGTGVTNGTPQGNYAGDQQDTCEVSNGITVESELNKLRKARDKARQDREKAEGGFADTENRLKVLDGVEQDYPATKKAYDAAYPQLVREHDNLKDYLDCEEPKLKARLGTGPATEVNRLVDARDARTQDLEKAVAAAKAKPGQSTSPLEADQQAVKDRTAELNAWKNLTATVTAQQAELKRLREEVTKARQEGHYGLAYGLVLMALKRQAAHASGPRLVAPTALHQEFHAAGENLATAQKALAQAERTFGADKATLAVATKDLEEYQKSSEARLRVDLVDIKPAGEGTPATDGGTPSAGTGASAAGGGTPSTGGGGGPPAADAGAADAGGKATAAGAPSADAGDPPSADNDKTEDH